MLHKCPRIRFAGEQAERLGIDDPISWMNSIPPSVLDFWFALHIVKAEDAKGTQNVQKVMAERYG